MRFRSQLTNIVPFTKFTASLSSLAKVCWVRLEDEAVRFTIVPDQGTQVWAQLSIDTIFDSYTLSAAADVINLEVPTAALHRALKSAAEATSASLRLTKKGSQPLLALTIVSSSWTTGKNALGVAGPSSGSAARNQSETGNGQPSTATEQERIHVGPRERETVITQEIPVRVIHPSVIESLHEPRCRDPDVHIVLPSLIQLKIISERFNKLATDTMRSNNSGATLVGGVGSSAKLELSANMHGSLKLGIATDTLKISSVWRGLVNPGLNVAQESQGEANSERMRALGGENGENEEGWATVRIDGKDWGRVLSVGRLSPKVVACRFTSAPVFGYFASSRSSEVPNLSSHSQASFIIPL
ncbi:Checkpoint protein hus1 [Emydomyces testavorans]|uniref:Checkpoint protein n=1 Tax=Emydomyces testavorans TaxID=2070801 RepID=A0AAF0DMF9_9EURO|nr:Checkpoint protein hus1 [Emydomyces testavorans]